MQNGRVTLEDILVVSQKTKCMLINHTIQLPKEVKTYIHTKTFTWIFLAALFIIVQTWKKPRYPSESEWISKQWYIQKYYSALKRNELSAMKNMEETLWMLLSERSQSEKATNV